MQVVAPRAHVTHLHGRYLVYMFIYICCKTLPPWWPVRASICGLNADRSDCRVAEWVVEWYPRLRDAPMQTTKLLHETTYCRENQSGAKRACTTSMTSNKMG